MIRPPFAARVAAGIAVTAVEEARRLPTTAVTLPMTAVSQFLQTTMRVQQSMTTLAIKGDQAFALVHWTNEEEQPEWASFDEDEPSPSPAPEPEDRNGAQGRFALYSLGPDDAPASPTSTNGAKTPAATPKPRKVPEPEIAVYLDYGTLTLAQLRARLRNLSVEDLSTLLEYENATQGRAPFQTMLTNRITSAKAK
ncbi:lipid droplet-associated protein [Rhodococcus sp. NPDC058521]|uniref:lipid droplet-associated protein n=1 Tax=Rhodococcus sp. NPDC058521 TaxID=3346536 RepID=UPI003668785D